MKAIIDKENGSNFFKCDLHIHTQTSKCYQQPGIKAEDIIKKSIEKGLKIIAVTDHNSDGSFPEIIESSEGTDLLVLPGVEITTPQGGAAQIHILAIFNKSDYRKVDELLIKIGISHEQRARSETVAKKTIPEIMTIVNELGGISLLSHVDSNGGIDVEIPTLTPTKQEILDCVALNGIEITDLCSADRYDGYACIRSSDSHSLDKIGQRFTLIKMGNPSFEGLRQALGDHESRIRLSRDDLPSYPRIIGMKFEGGFLDDQVIHFNKCLNCLIGGKGTGKSTVIELIRYVLDNLSTDAEILEIETKHIRDVLSIGKISLAIETNSGERYMIERTYDEEPHILSVDGDEISIDIKQFKEGFFKVDAYSQTELLKISRSSKNQLKMIDQYINFENLKSDRDLIINDLETNESRIVEKDSAISALIGKVGEIQTIREKIRVLESKGTKDILEDHLLWEDENRFLHDMYKSLEKELQQWKDLQAETQNNILTDNLKKLENLPKQEVLRKSIELLEDSNDKVRIYLEIIILKLIEKRQDLNDLIAAWDKDYHDKNEDLRKLFMDLESSGTTIEYYEDYLKLEKKKKELEEIVTKIEREQKALSELKEKRLNILQKFKINRDEIYKARLELINKINLAFEGFIKIKIEKEKDVSIYSNYLVDEILSSSGNRISKVDRAKIAQMVHPMRLAELTEKDDFESLVTEAGISEEIAKKTIALVKSKIYKIQMIDVEDKITIQLNDHSWKELSSCSDGQKCTAILSIAMYERNIPLIIDQPEDSLDNSFIYREVVKIIRKIKNERQLIIATHNANIPVLGDSELILVMASDGKNGFITERGVIDKDRIKKLVQNILEGGRDAFERRKLKYGI
jgi:ABC-type lipoprotein export system ATPase subunit